MFHPFPHPQHFHSSALEQRGVVTSLASAGVQTTPGDPHSAQNLTPLVAEILKTFWNIGMTIMQLLSQWHSWTALESQIGFGLIQFFECHQVYHCFLLVTDLLDNGTVIY